MKKTGRIALIGAGLLFLIFFSNVSLGAFSGQPFLGDIPEMLTLLASAMLFVVAVLQIEADHQKE